MNYQPSLFAPTNPDSLRDDLKGVLPDEYASLLIAAGLDHNRQGIAIRRLVERPRASLQWFAGVCQALAIEQAAAGPKQGMMF